MKAIVHRHCKQGKQDWVELIVGRDRVGTIEARPTPEGVTSKKGYQTVITLFDYSVELPTEPTENIEAAIRIWSNSILHLEKVECVNG